MRGSSLGRARRRAGLKAIAAVVVALSIIPIPATNAQPGGDPESTSVPSTSTEDEAGSTELGEGAPDTTVDVGPTTTVPQEAANAAEVPSDLAVTPLAVGDATIRVNKAGVREGEATSAGASGLAGATFVAYHKGDSETQSIPNRPPDATCTTDASGICDLSVDPDLGPRYLVVEQSAPTGWRKIDQIALGRFNASGTPRDYRWNVRVRNGQTTEVPETEIRNSSTQNWRDRPGRPGGSDPYRWADVKDNVPYPEGQCGLSIAMLFDLSGSIGNNLPLVKNAATEFVDDLTGTPTSIAVFTFSTNSPQNIGGSQNRPTPVSIADADGAAQVKGFINGFSAAGGGTNWDEGLRRIAGAGHDYDITIVLTDGNPTAWRGEKSSTSDVDDYDVEEAVHSANWLKELGTRVVAVGFSGQAGGLTALNLEHISGPIEDDDYYLTTFGELADVLAEIALRACGGTINVLKKVAPTWDGITDVPQEPNWRFQRATDQDYVDPSSGTTGPNGEPVTFRVTFAPNELEREVTITENPGSYKLIPAPDGRNTRCLINGQEDPTRIQNEVNGFTITDVKFTEIISCQVVNNPAGLEALKYDDLNGNGQRDDGEPPLQGWTVFLDANGNSQLDPGERSAVTDSNGLVTFDRLDAPADYRVCEVPHSGWFNTDPGGTEPCKGPISVEVGETAGPVLFGNQQAGGFTVTKAVVDVSGLVPPDTEYTVSVACTTPDGGPVAGYPRDLLLTDGDTVNVGPLPFGTVCDITETDQAGAGSVSVVPDEVTIGEGDAVNVVVTNTYPVGRATIAKVTDGPLAILAPEGTPFTVEVTCSYPDGFPASGQIPGFDPLELTIRAGSPGQPGTRVGFGPLPVGSECSMVETDDGGASEVAIEPNPVTITGSAEPVSVTVTNTFDPAALRILKEVRGTPLPPDTVFTAHVVCTFDGVERFNDDVEFSVNNPGLVTNLPVGSSCTVTETDSQGAQAVTISPDQPVILVGPSPVSVDVTITNTFEAPGEVTIAKVIEGVQSPILPDGTSYTVQVACSFDGMPLDGYPRSLTFTTPDQLSETLTDLPVGSECTVTETDSQGAQVEITPPQPVTITGEGEEPVTVTVSNTYEVDRFSITKVVVDPTGLVPGDTEYTVEARCTYPADFPGTGEIPGFDPLQITLTDGQTVATGELPVASTCTITETDSAGAASSSVVPDRVVVGEGEDPVTVTVTNTYAEGALVLQKAVDDGGTGLVPRNTEYTLEVACEYPAGFPVQGPIPGFDPDQVTVGSGVQGNPGAPVTVGPLPVGAQCTVTEPDPQGAANVEISPPQPVTVTDDPGDPVTVTVANTYPVGAGRVVKIADGPLALQLAPQGTEFTVDVACTFPDDFPIQGQIPGYDPRGLSIDAGEPGQPGTPTPFGPLPLGSRCTVVETDDRGASEVDISPDQPVTIDSPDTPVAVTVTNTFLPASLRVSKVIDGPGAGAVPPDLEFTAGVVCVFEGEVFSDTEVVFTVDRPGVVTDQPKFSSCTVTELDSQGADSVTISPDQPVILEGDDPVLVDVTVTNTFGAGDLTITKVVAGDGAAFIPDGTTFELQAGCEYNGSPLDGYPRIVTLTTPDQLTETLTGLPVGSECTVVELDSLGAQSVVITPTQPVTIVNGAQGPVEVTATNTYPAGSFEIEKVVDGDLASLAPEGTRFTVAVTCEYPPSPYPATGTIPGFDPLTVNIEAGPSGLPGPPTNVGPLPTGSTCTITETDSNGASETTIVPSQIRVAEGNDAAVEVTVTNTYDPAALQILKVVDGDGASLIPPDTVFTAHVVCTFLGNEEFNRPVEFGVNDPGIVSALPVGTSCTVTEPGDQGASSVDISPPQPVILEGEDPVSVDVTVTNTYDAGELTVTKALDGDGAPFVPPGTTYTVNVACTFDGQALPGYPQDITLNAPGGGPVTLSGLPVGTVCTVTETDSQGAQGVTITPDQPVTITGETSPVDVTVTNTYGVGDLTITKTLAGAPVPEGTSFAIEVACSFLGADLPVREITLTTPAALIGTVSGLPVGAECTLDETDDGGASNVEITPNPVTITDGATPVEVIVTNTFDSGELTVTKVLSGAGAGFVPDGTTFTVEATCTLDQLPLPVETVTLTTPDQLTQTVTDLPVGAECTLTETEDNGAGSVTIEPNPVTVGSGDPVQVTVTNAYPAGSFEIEKVVEDQAGFVPSDTVYTIEASCSYPAGYPVQGLIPGFDPLVLTLTDGQSKTVGPLPVGANCTIRETDTAGASVSVVPESITVDDGSTPGAEVIVTNTYAAGSAQVTKVVDGELSDLAPPSFPIEVSCTYPGGYPVQGPVPGFDPLQVDLGDGQTASVGPLPVGTSCTVVEVDDRGASAVSYLPDDEFTITGGEQQVEITVVNTFEAAELRISKVIDGPGASFVPPDTVYVADVVCTFQGLTSVSEVSFSVGSPGVVDGLPVGAQCTVTESNTNGAEHVSIEPPQPVTLEGARPVSIDVTITNVYGVGTLTVTKALAGSGAPTVPDGTAFTVQVACSFLGESLPVETLTLMTPDQLTQSVSGLPAGALCTITETEDNGAQEVTIEPEQVTIIAGGTSVEATVTNTFEAGSILIEKVVTGTGSSSADEPFNFRVTCTYRGSVLDPPNFATITPPATSATVSGLPIGASCGIEELSDYGGADGPPTISPASVVVESGLPVAVTVTNTFTKPPPLPMTGSDIDRALALAAILFALGAALLIVTRRLRPRSELS